jgi:hypothetical protein
MIDVKGFSACAALCVCAESEAYHMLICMYPPHVRWCVFVQRTKCQKRPHRKVKKRSSTRIKEMSTHVIDNVNTEVLTVIQHLLSLLLRHVCVYYCRTYYKAVRGGEGEESGGHVL